jgi:hypothetical protein
MPVIYVEGEVRAFGRLRKEIDPVLESGLNKCLVNLRITDPRGGKSRIESTKGGILADWSRWLLEHDDFRQWRNDEDSRLLWIKSDPRKGKTMLLCNVADALSGLPANESLVLCPTSSAKPQIRTWTTQQPCFVVLSICSSDRTARYWKQLYEKYKTTGKKLFEDANAWDALLRVLTAMLQNHKTSKLIFIVDALDD